MSNLPKIDFDAIRSDGEKFGYPKCCIEAIIEGWNKHDGERKLSGTGFYPCEKCNSTKSEQQLVDEINKNRKVDYLFPMSARGLSLLSEKTRNQVLKELEKVAYDQYAEKIDKLKIRFNEETALRFVIWHLYEFGEFLDL